VRATAHHHLLLHQLQMKISVSINAKILNTCFGIVHVSQAALYHSQKIALNLKISVNTLVMMMNSSTGIHHANQSV